LAKYASEGHDVRILTTTRGEGGTTGVPSLCTREELGQVREVEGRAAAKALGASDVIYLPYVDPVPDADGTAKAIDAPLEAFSGSIADVLRAIQPDVVITHGAGGEYGHPQHKYTHTAVFAALRDLKPWTPREVWTWSARPLLPEHQFAPDDPNYRMINHDEPADIEIDITPWLPQVGAAFAAHQTQFSGFLQENPGKTMVDLIPHFEALHRWDV
jgi:LmbE family N-acetylglucosaminyl deacetylase